MEPSSNTPPPIPEFNPKLHFSHPKYTKNELSQHPLLRDAKVIESDYPFMRTMIAIWTEFVNLAPVFAIARYFSPHAKAYENELTGISKLSNDTVTHIKEATEVHGGETETDYLKLEKKYAHWRYTDLHAKPMNQPTFINYFYKSDSLEAAKNYKEVHPNAKIVITNFANGVRVGGADRSLGKGSQEEQLLRKTALRVSLEATNQLADAQIRENTGRYLPYYSAIISKDVPTFDDPNTTFGYVSSAAPDRRTNSFRSEGDYFENEEPDLIKEVLYRKLAVILMASALSGYDVLVLGAFGCGAFENDPKMVAEVLKDLLMEPRFLGVFTDVILPIGMDDKNRAPFEEVFPVSNEGS